MRLGLLSNWTYSLWQQRTRPLTAAPLIPCWATMTLLDLLPIWFCAFNEDWVCLPWHLFTELTPTREERVMGCQFISLCFVWIPYLHSFPFSLCQDETWVNLGFALGWWIGTFYCTNPIQSIFSTMSQGMLQQQQPGWAKPSLVVGKPGAGIDGLGNLRCNLNA